MTAAAFEALARGCVRPDLLSQIADEVAIVEAELDRQVASQVALVSDVARHTLGAGGKRLRPAFIALAAKATGLPFDPARTRALGACMEMIHMATLIHDDVIDGAATRRGRPTASSAFGNTASILSGDCLLARSMAILAEDGDVEIIRVASKAVVDMAEGEVRELEARGDFDLSQDEYLEIVRFKTARFIEACCAAGAMVAGASSATREALRRYGSHVGVAFQIVDDLLDYRGDQAETGKPPAADFREGQATLPLIYLREELSEAEATRLRLSFGAGVSPEQLRSIVELMRSRGSFARTESTAHDHICLALDALDGLPDNASRDLLQALAEYVLLRQA